MWKSWRLLNVVTSFTVCAWKQSVTDPEKVAVVESNAGFPSLRRVHLFWPTPSASEALAGAGKADKMSLNLQSLAKQSN